MTIPNSPILTTNQLTCLDRDDDDCSLCHPDSIIMHLQDASIDHGGVFLLETLDRVDDNSIHDCFSFSTDSQDHGGVFVLDTLNPVDDNSIPDSFSFPKDSQDYDSSIHATGSSFSFSFCGKDHQDQTTSYVHAHGQGFDSSLHRSSGDVRFSAAQHRSSSGRHGAPGSMDVPKSSSLPLTSIPGPSLLLSSSPTMTPSMFSSSSSVSSSLSGGEGECVGGGGGGCGFFSSDSSSSRESTAGSHNCNDWISTCRYNSEEVYRSSNVSTDELSCIKEEFDRKHPGQLPKHWIGTEHDNKDTCHQMGPLESRKSSYVQYDHVGTAKQMHIHCQAPPKPCHLTAPKSRASQVMQCDSSHTAHGELSKQMHFQSPNSVSLAHLLVQNTSTRHHQTSSGKSSPKPLFKWTRTLSLRVRPTFVHDSGDDPHRLSGDGFNWLASQAHKRNNRRFSSPRAFRWRSVLSLQPFNPPHTSSRSDLRGGMLFSRSLRQSDESKIDAEKNGLAGKLRHNRSINRQRHDGDDTQHSSRFGRGGHRLHSISKEIMESSMVRTIKSMLELRPCADEGGVVLTASSNGGSRKNKEKRKPKTKETMPVICHAATANSIAGMINGRLLGGRKKEQGLHSHSVSNDRGHVAIQGAIAHCKNTNVPRDP